MTLFRRKLCVCNNVAGLILPGELPSLTPSPSRVYYPCQMSSNEFKNHLRNMKYFLLTGNLNSRSNFCNIEQSDCR